MNLIFLGPPGVGKGTVAKLLCVEKGLIQISTGDLLRQAVKDGSELGVKAKGYMDSGGLVPDELVIGLLKERISQKDCEKGFVLDGFPRTIAQAESLFTSGVAIDKVLHYTAKEETIIFRISGRRTCKNCGAIYHVKNIPPKQEGVCDKCQGELFQRDDDKKEAIAKRLATYKEQTEPLVRFYSEKGMLISIDTDVSLDEIYKNTLEAIS